MKISDKIKSILNAAAKSGNIGDIANELGVSVQVVSGSLAAIKKEHLATYENKTLLLTDEGLAAIGIDVSVSEDKPTEPVKKVKNKDIVANIYAANIAAGSKTVVDLVCQALGIDKVNARVYIYNHEKRVGLRTVGQKTATPA